MRYAVRVLIGCLMLLLTSCSGVSDPLVARPGGNLSGTGLFISDIHFNPLADPTLANRLAQAPAAQWDSIFATSAVTRYSPYGPKGAFYDTNFPLLQSALAAMRQRVPDPDVVFFSGDFLVHEFPVLYGKLLANQSTSYAALVNTTEQYLAIKLSQTFPKAQIVPALGDWDTPCNTSDTYPGTGFLASFSSAWNAAVNRYGGAPDFQATFSKGGYYSTALPIGPQGRLIVLDTLPWTPNYAAVCGQAGGGTLGTTELGWLAAQLDDARKNGQRVWILGHVPPGVPGGNPTNAPLGVDASSRALSATGASCPIAPFYLDAYSSKLYALFAKNRDILALGIFGHEHMDDFRVLLDSSGSPIFGMQLVPSITPLDGNNPAFVQFTYDRSAGAISDATTWYLTNLPSATTAAPGAWGLEYDFDSTYGQHALDSNAIAGAVNQILTKPSATSAFARYYPSSSSAAVGLTPFLPYSCALDKITAADYSTCYCGH